MRTRTAPPLQHAMGETSASVVWIAGTFARPRVRATSRAIRCSSGGASREAPRRKRRNPRVRASVHPSTATAPTSHRSTSPNPPCPSSHPPSTAPPRTAGPASPTAIEAGDAASGDSAAAEMSAVGSGRSKGTAISGGMSSPASSVRQSAWHRRGRRLPRTASHTAAPRTTEMASLLPAICRARSVISPPATAAGVPCRRRRVSAPPPSARSSAPEILRSPDPREPRDARRRRPHG